MLKYGVNRTILLFLIIYTLNRDFYIITCSKAGFCIDDTSLQRATPQSAPFLCSYDPSPFLQSYT